MQPISRRGETRSKGSSRERGRRNVTNAGKTAASNGSAATKEIKEGGATGAAATPAAAATTIATATRIQRPVPAKARRRTAVRARSTRGRLPAAASHPTAAVGATATTAATRTTAARMTGSPVTYIGDTAISDVEQHLCRRQWYMGVKTYVGSPRLR